MQHHGVDTKICKCMLFDMFLKMDSHRLVQSKKILEPSHETQKCLSYRVLNPITK